MAKKKALLTDALSQIGKVEELEKKAKGIKEKAKTYVEDYKEEKQQFEKQNAINNDSQKFTADGRKRFNTMLSPDLKKRLRNYGEDHGMTIADVIEVMANEFLRKKKY